MTHVLCTAMRPTKRNYADRAEIESLLLDSVRPIQDRERKGFVRELLKLRRAVPGTLPCWAFFVGSVRFETLPSPGR